MQCWARGFRRMVVMRIMRVIRLMPQLIPVIFRARASALKTCTGSLMARETALAGACCCASRTSTDREPGPTLTDGLWTHLNWLGLAWDGDPIYQSQRAAIYEDALLSLMSLELTADGGLRLRGRAGDVSSSGWADTVDSHGLADSITAGCADVGFIKLIVAWVFDFQRV